MTEDAATRRDLERHEREIEKLWEQKASKVDLARVEQSRSEDRDEIRNLRRSVIGAAITFAVFAVGSTVTVLEAISQ